MNDTTGNLFAGQDEPFCMVVEEADMPGVIEYPADRSNQSNLFTQDTEGDA